MSRELTAGQAVDLMLAGEHVIDPDGIESWFEDGAWCTRLEGHEVTTCKSSDCNVISHVLSRKGWKRKPVTDADLVKKWRAQAVAFRQSAELIRGRQNASTADYWSEVSKAQILELTADELEKRGEL